MSYQPSWSMFYQRWPISHQLGPCYQPYPCITNLGLVSSTLAHVLTTFLTYDLSTLAHFLSTLAHVLLTLSMYYHPWPCIINFSPCLTNLLDLCVYQPWLIFLSTSAHVINLGPFPTNLGSCRARCPPSDPCPVPPAAESGMRPQHRAVQTTRRRGTVWPTLFTVKC